MSLSSLLSSVVASSKHTSMTEELGAVTANGESIDFAALLTEQMNDAELGTPSAASDNNLHAITDATPKQQSTASFAPLPSSDPGGIFSLFETVVAQFNGLPHRTHPGATEKNGATGDSAITNNHTQFSTNEVRPNPRSAHAFEPKVFSGSPLHSSLSESTDSQPNGLSPWTSQSLDEHLNSGSPVEKASLPQTELDEAPSIDSTFTLPGNSAASRQDQFSNTDKLQVDSTGMPLASPYPSAENSDQILALVQDTARQEFGKAAPKTASINDRMAANEVVKSAIGSVTSETQTHQTESTQGQITPLPFNGASSSISNLTIRTNTSQKSPQSAEISAITNGEASAPALAKFADVISMKGGQPLATEVPVASNEPAKPAGDILPPLPANTAGPLERPQSAMRMDSPHSIATSLNDPRWSNQFGDRVVWLARGEIQNAQININPTQLGPIQINISLNGDQMSAHFVAAHQEVRQAIEDAMPRLREMLSGAGINLGQANVGAQTQQQQRESSAHLGERPRSVGEDAILSPDNHTASNIVGRPIQQGKGLVDLFA